jgi:hypothetical protein
MLTENRSSGSPLRQRPRTRRASEVTAKLHAVAQSQPRDASGDLIKRHISDFERDPENFKPQQIMKTPPGSPIGDGEIL